MSDLLKSVEELSPERRALFELLLKEKQQQRRTAQTQTIPRRRSLDSAPLSFSQQRLWFLNQLEPDSPVYSIPAAVRWRDPLNVRALLRSIHEIIRRHDILRATFVARAGQPLQIIAPSLSVPMPLIDLQALGAVEREDEVVRLAAEEARRPFDLAHGPLIRFTLLRLGGQEHVLLLTMHHIVSDAWSTKILIRELVTLYRAFCAGLPASLPDLPIQYTDFAAWQQQWLHGEILEKQVAYWRQALDGAPALLELPGDRPRPAIQGFRGAQQPIALPGELSAGLMALSRQAGTTLFMTVLAAFQVLLARYSGQTDIVVGTPIAGRNYTETTNVIGLFVNILVLRSDLSGNPTFAELLARVQQVALGAYAHQDLPFEYLVKELEPERNLSYAPLVQVLCAVQSALPSSEDVGDLPDYWQVSRGAAQFDLSLNLWEIPNGLNGFLEYSSDLFEAATIARMAEQFATLLASSVAQPHVRLAALPLLSVAEQRQLHAWSAPQAAYPTTLSLHQLFEAQAARSPDAVALVFDGPTTNDERPTTENQEPRTKNQEPRADDHTTTQNSKLNTQNFSSNTQHPTPNTQRLTYRELNERANRLAQHLRALGVGPEMRVGVCMERSLELVVALLGILKAGGAYVPLDPGYPPERLAFMIEDAQVAVLLTTNDQRPPTNDRRPTTDDQRPTTDDPFTPSPLHPFTPSPCHLVTLSRSWSAIALCAADNPVGALDPANLAYLIYTSGSTGLPKGAMNAHAGIVNRLHWMQDAYCLTADDRVLQKTPFSFDVSVWEFFWPLMAGACLVLAQPGGHQDPAYLVRLIAEEQITTVHFVPSMLAVFLEQPRVERCAGLRRVICSGEELNAGLQKRFFARLGGASGRDGPQLHNLYGPTEAAVDVTAWACQPGDDQASVPIGRPIANVQIYILDAHCQPLPIGVPGELHIGGVQLARGYLNRPDLTAERFIPNPFGEVLGDGCWVLEDSAPNTQHPTPNTRLYRSGDRARWLAEGTLEYLGRLDEQVKLRGYRVELGEVAAALRQHPAVIDTAVLVREDASGEKRLVAYVVQGSGVRGQESTTPLPPPAGGGTEGGRSQESGVRSQEPTGSAEADSLLHSAFCILHSDELRDFLKEKLPDYMIPAAFVLLDALPLTAHGKVDQRALPAPTWASQAPAARFVAARTPEEALLAQIWADVLGVAQAGVHDNFFALGGHSLLATQVVARVRETFQVELPVRALFETPTVAELAERVALAARTARGLQIPPLLPVARDAPLPLSFAQQRLWFLDQLQPFSSAYNLPIALRLTGELDLAALHWSLGELVRRHEALRTSFPMLEGQPVQQIALPTDVPLPLLDVSALPATEREAVAHRLATAAARRPFDLARGPLLRAALLRLAPADHMLLLSVHHIVADGWSMGVLVTDCMAFYAAASVGHPLSLPALPIQYADYAVWQRAWLQGSGVRGQGTGGQGGTETRRLLETPSPTPNTQHPTPIEAQLGYWRRQLADLPALTLPTDRPQPPIQSFRGARQQCMLPGELSAGLMALSRQAGTTLFMTLLAAFQVLLARYTEQDDIAVGTPIAGRSQRETEHLIGCFVNTLVIRTDLSGNPTFQEVLRRVREVALDAYAHQHVPFEQVVEAIQPERDMSRSPLFQVMFVLQNAPLAPLELSNVQARLIEIDPGTAKFDLSLTLAEAGAGLIGTLEYSSDLFEAATIARMVEQFATLLAGLLAAPAQCVAALPLLSIVEQRQLHAWSAAQTTYPTAQCLHQLFEAQAARSPDAVAVVYPGVRGQGSGVRETRRQGDKETRSQESGVRSQESEFLAPNRQSPTPLPPPAGGGTEGGRAWASAPLSPQSSVLSPQSLTYAELNARANQLAHHLRGLGVGSETPVGICMERSPEMVIGLLGILKAGGAYVPLDPDYPQERLAFMLEDAQVPVLLTTNDQRPTTNDQRPTTNDGEPRTKNQEPGTDVESITQNSKLKTQNCAPSPPHLVTLSDSWPAISLCAAEDPVGALDPANLAYVIYTSGSTGRPKGTLISHANVARLLAATQPAFQFSGADVWTLFHSYAFDFAVWEIWGALLHGGRLVIVHALIGRAPDQFAQLLARERVSVLNQTPSAVRQLVAAGAGALRALGLRLMIFGGEALAVEPLRAWWTGAEAAPRLVNMYGITETTVHTTAHWLTEADLLPGAPNRIGRPLSDTQSYVVDRTGRLAPVGVAGELWIGGAGLARGYLNRPDLTAERFVPNPFGEVLGDGCWVTEDSAPNTQHPTPNTRLYQSGDRARWLADGTLEYLGRLDEQVKLRGYRVELGEVAAALRQHAAVREAVVVLREDAPGDRRLVAYLVMRTEGRGLSGPDSSVLSPQSSVLSELRAFLKEKLPGYMLPAAFVMLDALPLTPSGKLDRRALPAPDNSRSAAGDDFVAPRTPVEELLAQIWADVLRLERVGASDNFFALGGHSLLATQLIARVREALQVELPLRSLFEAPTLADLATRITTARHDGLASSALPLRPLARTGALPLSFAQQRLWFFDQLQPRSSAYIISTAVRMAGALDLLALWRSLSAIIGRHEVLRTTFAALDGQPVQHIRAAYPASLPLLDLQALPQHERDQAARRLATAEARRPFDLSSGPLLRVTLLRLAAQQHVALLTMHHIIADAWSMEVLIREIAALYSAFAAGQPARLPELPIQYADYAAWQRAWLQGSGVRGQESGVRGQGTGDRGQGATTPLSPPAGGGTEGGAETRRQGDKETRSTGPQYPTPNTQHPTPIQAHLAYWKQQLAELPALELPTDFPRPPAESFHGAHHDFALPQPLHEGLAALNRTEGVTLFMTLLAAFQALLSRYSGQDDIAIGTPIANRGRAETENLIGLFVNTLVLRTDLGGAATFRALLHRVRATCLDAYAHQNLPFEQVVEALAPTRDLSRHPLFQVMCTLEHAPAVELALPNLALRPLEVAHGTVHFDLSLALRASGSRLGGVLRYRTDLFEAATIERMLGHLQTLLAGVLADPERRLADLPILTDAEQQQLLVEWNATQAPYPDDRCIHQLFEEQAARTPDAVAVIFDGRPTTNDQRPTTNDQRPRIASFPSSVLSPQSSVLSPQSLTYAELNERANRLAHHLRALGVTPEVPVATCLERALPQIVALLAIFKAGGAYLPLNPRYPGEQLAFMLHDAQAAVLLTQKSIYDLRFTTYDLEESGPAIVNRKSKIVNLDAEWAVIAAAPGHNLGVTAAPTQLAYLIYTSGTTGRPKAVMVEHHSLVNTLCASQARYQFGAQGRQAALLSFAFDISLFEAFSPLLVGGTLVLIAEEQVLDLPRLVAVLRDLTFFHCTPGLLRQIVDFILTADQPAMYRRVQQIAVGGDVIPPALLDDVQRAFPAAQLYIGYGPTEATIMTTNYVVSRAAVPRTYVIGQPMQNMQVQLYDRRGQLVPIGVPGEIYIGGAGVARGYLNRPELTAERFLPNPFARVLGDGCWVLEDSAPVTQHPTPNTRLYKTGDLARWSREGVLEFLGRIDDQVKVRGFRIELGEVEAVLGRHTDVRACVVVARADGAGEVRLVAYLVTSDKSQVTSEDGDGLVTRHSSLVTQLRSFLQEQLPDYMVPSAFVLLDALPLTAHGKVDRQRLPAPDIAGSHTEGAFVAPRTAIEERLAGIWATILGIEQISVHDNFFALGGHSLLAIQLISHLRQAFPVELPLRRLFEGSTIAQLAEVIEEELVAKLAELSEEDALKLL